jgi:hypothetical protein
MADLVLASTVRTGDVNFQGTSTCVTDGHVELDMFEKTDDIVLSFTTGHFEVNFQWTSGTQLSRDTNNPAAIVHQSIERTVV